LLVKYVDVISHADCSLIFMSKRRYWLL